MGLLLLVHTDSFLLYIVWAVSIGNEPRLRLYLMLYCPMLYGILPYMANETRYMLMYTIRNAAKYRVYICWFLLIICYKYASICVNPNGMPTIAIPSRNVCNVLSPMYVFNKP